MIFNHKHDIDKDALKETIVESMVQFCRKSHIRLIAEGIETREELYTLINLGVNYGQGYYLKRPDKEISAIPAYIAAEIRNQYDKTVMFNPHQSSFGNIGEICRKGKTVFGKTSGKSIYEYICEHPSVTEIIVLDKNNMVDGILTREHIMNAFGGMYGYSLAARKTASELMIQNLAECIRKYCINGEFIGHIGGDDFVLIKNSSEILPLLKQIAKDFKCQIKKLYNAEDYDRGYIISKNRHGKIEKFPLVSISMAVICTKPDHKLTPKSFSKMLVKAKKKSKAKEGNSYYCIDA